jgi:hypothetical protein
MLAHDHSPGASFQNRTYWDSMALFWIPENTARQLSRWGYLLFSRRPYRAAKTAATKTMTLVRYQKYPAVIFNAIMYCMVLAKNWTYTAQQPVRLSNFWYYYCYWAIHIPDHDCHGTECVVLGIGNPFSCCHTVLFFLLLLFDFPLQ